MSKNMVELVTLCNLNMGQSPDSSTYNEEGNGLPFFQGNADFGEWHPNVRVWCSEPSKIANEGDVLISVRAPIGAMNIANQRCCIGRGLAALTPKDDVCTQKYLYYAVQSRVDELIAQGTGSTFKAISKKVLEQTLIPAYSITEQNEIVSKISKVDTEIKHRKEQQDLLDLLVKSKFVEMFGDPASNPMCWDECLLGERCEIITGNTPSRADEDNYGNYIEWIKSDNINTPNTYLTVAEEYLSEKGAKQGRIVGAGSVLMTCIAGSIGCIGNVAIADREVAFNQQINAIVPTQDEPLYIYWLMQLSKPYIQSTINMSLKGILSKGKLSQLDFPFPPVKLQKEFSDFVRINEKTKSAVQKSINELETLKKSLMQEYFE